MACTEASLGQHRDKEFPGQRKTHYPEQSSKSDWEPRKEAVPGDDSRGDAVRWEGSVAAQE